MTALLALLLEGLLPGRLRHFSNRRIHLYQSSTQSSHFLLALPRLLNFNLSAPPILLTFSKLFEKVIESVLLQLSHSSPPHPHKVRRGG